MKKLNIKIIIPILIFVIVGAVIVSIKQPKNEKEFLDKYSLNNLSLQQMVSHLEDNTDEDPGFYAAITGISLTIGDDNNDFYYQIPKDKFYLSLAPYINSTHPCTNHNLVSCRGELRNETMNIVVEDSNGKVIIDGDYTSYNNGFIGIWLPEDIIGTITVTYLGLTASSDITTYSTSNTCLTTLKLS